MLYKNHHQVLNWNVQQNLLNRMLSAKNEQVEQQLKYKYLILVELNYLKIVQQKSINL